MRIFSKAGDLIPILELIHAWWKSSVNYKEVFTSKILQALERNENIVIATNSLAEGDILYRMITKRIGFTLESSFGMVLLKALFSSLIMYSTILKVMLLIYVMRLLEGG